MYEELIEKMRCCSDQYRCGDCRFVEDCAGEEYLLDEAADAIEELQGQYHLMKKTAEWLSEKISKWIPVTERLPEEGEFVLVYGDLYPNKHDGGVIAVSKRMDWNYWQGFGRERNITHWMPLPEPPKEET